MVLDQSLKNNSYVSLINTNVTRAGTTYDANVTGGLFRFANKANSYALNGRVVYSNRRGKAFGSENEVADQNGYKYYLNFNKISGNFTWGLDHGIDHRSVLTEHSGSAARRVQCVHCKHVCEGVTTSLVECEGCGLLLLVRDHYSRRLAAFQGVCINAEDQSEQVPVEEVFR